MSVMLAYGVAKSDDLVRHAVVEAVAHRLERIRPVRASHAPPVVEADLERVRAGHVRERRPDVVRRAAVVGIHGIAPIHEPGDGATLLGDADHRGVEALLGIAADRLEPLEHAALEEQAVRERRRPVPLPRALDREPAQVAGFHGLRGAYGVRAVAGALVVERHRQLVPRRRLPGDAHLRRLPVVVVRGALARVGLEGPDVRIGVAIEEHSGHVGLGDVLPHACVEPELVPLDRAAEPRVDVPDLLDRVRRGQTAVLELRRQVARLHAAVGEAAEHRRR